MDRHRRTQRANLLPGLPARANGMQSNLVNASIAGVRLAHSTPLLNRRPCAITFQWRDRTIRFLAEPRWTNPAGDRYETGFEIIKIDPESNEGLRIMIESASDK